MKPSLASGRLLVMTAAVLWSTSGAFVKTSDLPALEIAVWRSLAAGAGLLVIFKLSGGRPTWDWRMAAMIVSFTLMAYLFIEAMTRTSAANTILLQYTAPMWMFLGSVFWLKEPVDRRTAIALAGAMIGILVILAGNWSTTAHEQSGILMALASGVAYAGVALSLRSLREHDSIWLATINHGGSGILLALIWGAEIAWSSDPSTIAGALPTARQFAIVGVFGLLQMALPYVLFGWGLRTVSPQEAGLLTLIEPVLNATWAFLVIHEKPSAATATGGSILLFMLAARYLPSYNRQAAKELNSSS